MRRVTAIERLSLALPILALVACSRVYGPLPDATGDALPGADAAPTSPERGVELAVDSGPAADAAIAPAATCAAGTRVGFAGAEDGLQTPGGVSYNVRTPADYDASVAHPLLVVFAPAGGTADGVERSTGLTADALQAGVVIAYVDHVSPTDIEGVADIADVPRWIAERWCIDASRIYLTGTSDGGSVIYMMLLNGYMTLPPAAIAPSAAGVSSETLAGVGCVTAPLPVMILHAANDTVFPGYGAQARDWWLACDGCGAAAGAPLADGCVVYGGCVDGVEVRYCEGDGGHGSWPPLNASLISFLTRYTRND